MASVRAPTRGHWRTVSANDPCRGRPLPVVQATPAPAPAPRHPGRWRAAVLIAVHVLFALHVVHWRLAGETLSPVEPSEGMQLATRSVLNAGAVFFGLALLSTVVLGRWFCGWGCHLVALQDGARALLLRVGITPRPLRSRALLVVPFLAFFYMFGWPFVERALAETTSGTRLALTTTRFWETFPGPLVALVTFLVCGGLAVLFLGSKGFCTYACPYGAAFGLLDRLAPWRIKVSDACNSCGQCTAVCSSNVIVHAEVRDYGAVVDPGCMKCLDCVSACPTGALSFGLARPAVLTRPRKPPQARPPAFGWGAEVGFALGFAAAFLAWRGLLHLVPFLLALGLAGCLAFVGWQALRALSGDPAKILAWPLRDEKRRLTRAGRLLLAGAGLSLAATLWAATVQFLDRRARAARDESGKTISPSWEAALAAPPVLDATRRAEVEAAADRERLLRRLGLGLDPEVELRLAWFALLLGDDATVEASAKAGLAAIEDAGPLRLDWARFLAARGRHADALVEWRRLLEARPGDPALEHAAGLAALGAGDRTAAEAHLERALALRRDPATLVALAFLCEKRGDAARAEALLREARAAGGR